jgi:drug/metabolite transporter (DMT)-like permease
VSPRHFHPSLPTASGLAAILLWSTTFGIARSLLEHVGPLTAGACAYLAGGFFCLLRLWWSGKTPRSLLKLSPRYLLGCGSLFVVYTAAIYLAVGLAKDRGQVIEVALVNYLWPALTILFSLPLLGRKANAWLLPGTVLALGGVLLVMTQGTQTSWLSFARHVQENPVAYGLALVAAVTWGGYSNLARRWSGPGSEGAVELFVPVTGIVLLAIRLFTTEPADWTARCAVEAAGLAAVTTTAYVLWDLSMRKGNMLLVVACSYFTPLLTTLVSCAYLRTTPGPKLWMGCLLLVTGSLVSWRSVADESLEPT